MATDPILLAHLKNINDGISEVRKDLSAHANDTRRLFEKHEDEIDAIKLARSEEAGERKAEAKQQRKTTAIIAGLISFIPVIIELLFGGHNK